MFEFTQHDNNDESNKCLMTLQFVDQIIWGVISLQAKHLHKRRFARFARFAGLAAFA